MKTIRSRPRSVLARASHSLSFLLVCALATACAREPAAQSEHAPQRIVPGNCSAAELLAVLVAPERFAALPEQIDAYSTLDAKVGPLARVPRYARYVGENVIALAPDLVVTHVWQNQDTTAALASRGIPVLVLQSATTFEEVKTSLHAVGRAVHAQERAAQVERSLDARVAQLAASAAPRAKLRAFVYSNDGTGGTTAGARTSIDTVIRLAGLRNASAEAGLEGHVPADFERVLAIDPDLFVVGAQAAGEGGSATRNVIEGAASLAGLRAVRERRIVVLSAALLSADSLGIVDAAEALAGEVDRVFGLATPR